MLDVQDLHAYYGASHVVQGISLSVGAGEAVALVGRNGVGKTSTLKSIMGLETRTRGKIVFEGTPLTGMASHVRAGTGLGYVPEERAVFPQMTVEENIRIGALLHRVAATSAACWTAPTRCSRSCASGACSWPARSAAASRRCWRWRAAWRCSPKLLLVDEPTEGLMPANVELITARAADGDPDGMAVLVVDSSFDLLRTLCSRLYAMDRGVLIGTYRAGRVLRARTSWRRDHAREARDA